MKELDRKAQDRAQTMLVQLRPTWKLIESALMDRFVSMEVPLAAFDWLPDTMPRYPRSHDRYYLDGGMDWPVRAIVHPANIDAYLNRAIQ